LKTRTEIRRELLLGAIFILFLIRSELASFFFRAIVLKEDRHVWFRLHDEFSGYSGWLIYL